MNFKETNGVWVSWGRQHGYTVELDSDGYFCTSGGNSQLSFDSLNEAFSYCEAVEDIEILQEELAKSAVRFTYYGDKLSESDSWDETWYVLCQTAEDVEKMRTLTYALLGALRVDAPTFVEKGTEKALFVWTSGDDESWELAPNIYAMLLSSM